MAFKNSDGSGRNILTFPTVLSLRQKQNLLHHHKYLNTPPPHTHTQCFQHPPHTCTVWQMVKSCSISEFVVKKLTV